jgi:hypothetical protein
MDFLTQHLISASRMLRREIASLRESIKAIHDQQERHHQERKTQDRLPKPSLRIEAEIQEPKATQRHNRSQGDRNFRVQICLTVGTWLAFFAAAYYAHEAHQQLSEMALGRDQVERGIILGRGQLAVANRNAASAEQTGLYVKTQAEAAKAQ